MTGRMTMRQADALDDARLALAAILKDARTGRLIGESYNDAAEWQDAYDKAEVLARFLANIESLAMRALRGD